MSAFSARQARTHSAALAPSACIGNESTPERKVWKLAGVVSPIQTQSTTTGPISRSRSSGRLP